MEQKGFNIQAIYSLVLGIVTSIFIGIGVNTVYPLPSDYTGYQSWAMITSMVVIAISTIFIVVAMALKKELTTISNGLLLGDFFTLIYGTGVGFFTDQSWYRFLVSAVAFVIVLTVGYIKFIKAKTPQVQPPVVAAPVIPQSDSYIEPTQQQ